MWIYTYTCVRITDGGTACTYKDTYKEHAVGAHSDIYGTHVYMLHTHEPSVIHIRSMQYRDVTGAMCLCTVMLLKDVWLPGL